MARKHLFIIIFTALVFSPSLSSSSASPTYERIVSLSPSVTEILFAIGAGDRVVGVSDYCDYPQEAKTKTKVGGYLNPSLERILALRPDLVVLSPNQGTKSVAKKLKEMNVDVLILSLYRLSEITEAYDAVGKKLGYEEQAGRLKAELAEKIESVTERVKGKPAKKVMFVRWHDPLYLAGKGSFENDIIELVGAENVANDSRVRYPVYNLEEIVKRDPDIVIDASYYSTLSKDKKDFIRNYWKKWSTLSVVRNKQVYIFNKDIHSVPGPRTPELIEEILCIVHPEVGEKGNNLHEALDV